ncbi:PMS1 protein homolog 1-like isoform X2 [Anneissia japonica]|uniref:PMS1 protein homolog 1-like isoform X2 n=1 Tax=Anneissia japonica TaxID=1529436 RepID=UPI001425A20E|nr:PMS1 protein homolog 1-like isoform X2 [Anneissia japonica]
MNSMKPLPADTVRLITSSQVITSIFSIVKELVENSLDANATNIEIKLENYGFDKIEIRDDGSGIPLDNIPYMGQQHFTSKISQLSDLQQLVTYGFRGEALASLCAVASVSIATKTQADPISMVYSLDHQGKVSSSKPCHLGIGTTVTAVNLFKNTPVRKQFFSSVKRRKDELKKVEDLLMQFAVIRPNIRFLLRNDKTVILQKNKLADHKAALASVWGRNVIAAMEKISIVIGDAKAECFLPKPEADLQLISRSSNDRCWVSVNGRPVFYKEIEKIIKHCVRGCYPTQSSGRYPFAFVSINLPPDSIDVNLEPNKTKVLIQQKESILEAIEEKLQELYKTGSKEDHQLANPDVCTSKGNGDNVANSNKGRNGMRSHESIRQNIPQNQSLVESMDYQCSVLGSMRPHGSVLENNAQDHSIDDSTTYSTMLGCSNGVIPQGSVTENLSQEPSKGYSAVSSSCNSIIPQGSVTENPPQEHSIDASTASNTVLGSSNSVMPQGSVKQKLPQELTFDATTAPCSAGLGGNQLIPQRSVNQFILQDYSPDTSTVSCSEKLSSQGTDENALLDAHCTDTNVLRKDLNNDYHNSLDITTEPLTHPDSKSAVPTNGNPGTGSSDLIDNRKFDLLAGNDELTDSALMDFLEEKCEPTEVSLNDSTIEGLIQSANQIEASEWSKGKGLVDKLGRPVEPGRLLLPTPNTSNQNPDDSSLKDDKDLLKVERKLLTPCREKKPIQERMGQATFYNLVGKTPIKRPQTAYIFFCKEMRPKIIKDNPTADFQTIAKLTGEKWRELSEEDKSKYEDLRKEDVQRYKEQVKEAKENLVQEPVRKKKCIKQPPQQMLVDKLFSSPVRASVPTTPAIKSVDVTFSFAGLKAELQNKKWMSQERCHLIGQLPNGFWICKDDDQLQLLNHHRLEEMLLYHRLLAKHRLQIQPLQPPVTLSPSMVGGHENWQTLMTMKSHVSAVDATRIFIDERLVANGFEIKQTEDNESGHVRLQVTGMATNIPCYGLADLAELLNLIGCSSNSCISLQESRPVKLIHYLQGEAVRLARDLPHRSSQDDILDMVDRQRALLPMNSHSCIHNKPFYHTLHTINDVRS